MTNDAVSASDELISMKIARTLRNNRHWLIASALLSVVASIIVPFFIMKPVYKASITFLPPSSSSSAGSALSGLIGSKDISLTTASDISSDQVIALFGTEKLFNALVKKFDLDSHYHIKKSELSRFKAKKELKHHLSVSSNETGGFGVSNITSIELDAEDGSPDTAKMLADEAFRIIDSTIIGIRISKSGVERVFLQTRLDSAVLSLRDIQDSLKHFLKKNEMLNAESKIETGVSNEAFLEKSILQKEAEANALQKIHGSSSSDYEAAKGELNAYQKQLSSLKSRGIQGNMGTRKTIDAGVTYANLLRDEEIAMKMVAGLNGQVNMSALGEARNMTSLVVIDPSTIPEWKEKPKRILVAGAIFVVWNGVVLVMIAYFCLLKDLFRKNQFLRTLFLRSDR